MPQLTEAQKAIRGSRIGASELGAICPPYIHPWTSRAQIYARIVDGPDTPVDNAYMRAGHTLERAIGRAVADDLGIKLRACSRTYIHPDLPLAASPDFYADDGTLGLCEVKLVRDWSDWLDGPPPYVLWQVRAQMALTGRAWCIVAALVGTTLQHHRIERDPAAEAELIASVERFNADHLEPRHPPASIDERLILRWHLEPGTLISGGELEAAGDDYAAQVRTRRKAEGWERSARARFVTELATEPGAQLVLGNGWSARIDDRGTLRFDVKARADE